MWYIEYPDFPDIPDDLLRLSFDELKTNCRFVGNQTAMDQEIYGAFVDTQAHQLIRVIRPYFDFNIHAIIYQYIGKNIIMHKDLHRTEAWNYLIDTGGDDVVTNWYDDEKNLLHSEVIPPRTWHKFNTGLFHDVNNITGKRFSITINKETI